jgi:hypothetical protein
VGKVFGKKYIGMLGEAATVGENLASGFATTLAAFIADVIVPLVVSSEDFEPGILSTSVDHAGEFHVYIDGGPASEVAYQRRRKTNRGS